MKNLIYPFVFTSLLLFTGCITIPTLTKPSMPPKAEEAEIVPEGAKPTLVILNFEDQSNFRGNWQIQSVFPNTIFDTIYPSGKVQLIERLTFNNLLGRLIREGEALFTSGDLSDAHNLSSADYVVSGIITDFRAMSETSGWFGPTLMAEAKEGMLSRISIKIRLSEGATGKIIDSFERTYSVKAHANEDPVEYHNIDMGSHLFGYTPLGRASLAVVTDISDSLVTLIEKHQNANPNLKQAIQNRAFTKKINTPQGHALPPTKALQQKTALAIKVLKATGKTITLDAGKNRNLEAGKHAVIRAFDGKRFAVAGLLAIDSVSEGSAIATLKEGTAPVGAIIEILD